MIEKLCEKYLEQKKYCDKYQYLSKYDKRMINEWIDAWVELVKIEFELKQALSGYEE